MVYDLAKIRAQFPILETKINGEDLVYLDNGASAQKPLAVIEAVNKAYSGEYANVHRGLHYLSNLATEKYERTRGVVAGFLGAQEKNIVFTTGSTEALNLVSYAWAMNNLKEGDEILLSVMEHHANIVPWQFLRERFGVALKWVDIDNDGALPAERVIEAISPRTKLIAISQMSNVTGAVVDVAAIANEARARGVVVAVDGSQGAVHQPVNVRDLGVDFYAITGHKLYGPTGTGALYVHEDRYDEMRPFMGGGDMIDQVSMDHVSYAAPPLKFEAGTPGIVETIGFGVALEYLMNLGMENIARHEAELAQYSMEKLTALDFLTIYGTTQDKAAIFSFNIEGTHAHDVSTIANEMGVAMRAGTHCAMPLMERFGVNASVRASFALYNSKAEVDKLVEALKLAKRLLA